MSFTTRQRGFSRTGWAATVADLRRGEEKQNDVGKMPDSSNWNSPMDLFQSLPPMGARDTSNGGRWTEPHHLAFYVRWLARSCSERLRMCFSAPPQHFKTSTLIVSLAWLCVRHPGRRHIYVSYSSERAQETLRLFCRVLSGLGIPNSSRGPEVTVGVGSVKSEVKFVGGMGGITGKPCDGLMIIDDPVKNAEEARSPTMRRKAIEGFNEDVMTRESVGGMSVLVMMTRWDVNDLVGVLVEKGWEFVNFKAVCDDQDSDPLGREEGDYLLPELKMKVDDARKADERSFYAQYQGEPLAPGLTVFDSPTFYTHLPATANVACYGLDAAYSSKKGSDLSYFVQVLTDRQTGLRYLGTVIRHHGRPEDFASKVVPVQRLRMGKVRWYTGGVEHIASRMMFEQLGVRWLECPPARKAPVVRAQKTSKAWNDGVLLVPADPSPDQQALLDECVGMQTDCVHIPDGVAALTAAMDLSLMGQGVPLAVPRNAGAMNEMAPSSRTKECPKTTGDQPGSQYGAWLKRRGEGSSHSHQERGSLVRQHTRISGRTVN